MRARRRRASAIARAFWNSVSSAVLSVPASFSCARRRASSARSTDISSACSATSASTVTRSGSTSRKPPPTKRICSGPPITSWILNGPGLRIQEVIGGPEQILFVGGGFLEVLPDRVTVLADVAEHADEISIERAEEARRRAQEKLAGTLTTAEETEFQNALAIAEARLRLARMRRG